MGIKEKTALYLSKFIPDKMYLRLKSRRILWYCFNFKNPKTYNEKLNWLKIYDRNPLYTQMVDKYEAKKYIEEKVGREYVIPTIWVWDKFDDIDFSRLPNKFVLKCNHNSWWNFIVKDKSSLNKSEAKETLNQLLKNNFYYQYRERPYKNVTPKIIAENLLENDDNSELIEYNIFCFNGIPKIIMTCHGDKRIKRYNDFYDIDFNKLNLKCNYDNSNIVDVKPINYNKMLTIAERLSKDIPQLRVDLYSCNWKIYVGELTFFHWAWFCSFEPKKWDKILWDLIVLPRENH